jgi:glycosyltransferase involved in cell wall biosynthesis
LRKKLGIFEGDFVVMFSGSMGLKQGMENVVQAARIAANRGSRAKWLLIGDGEVRQRVEAMISELGLKGTVFRIPFQPVDLVGPTLNAAQVLLLNQLASVKDTVIPSKLLTYMAAGRAVLAAVNPNSQGAEILRESGGGVLVAPGDPVALAEGILSLENDLGKLGVMGTANRAYAVEHFDQRRILSELESFTRGLLAPLHRVQGTPGAANPT